MHTEHLEVDQCSVTLLPVLLEGGEVHSSTLTGPTFQAHPDLLNKMSPSPFRLYLLLALIFALVCQG